MQWRSQTNISGEGLHLKFSLLLGYYFLLAKLNKHHHKNKFTSKTFRKGLYNLYLDISIVYLTDHKYQVLYNLDLNVLL